MPKSLTQVPSSHDNIQHSYQFEYDLKPPDPGTWPSGDYYGDGAGGRDAAHPTLRRCGVGLSHLIGSVHQFGVSCALPGDIQTVPRAEITAALICIMHLMHGALVRFYSDNFPFVQSFNKGRDHCRALLNADLYCELFELICDKELLFTG